MILIEELISTHEQMKLSLLDHLRERSCSPGVPLADLTNLENRKVDFLCILFLPTRFSSSVD